MNSIEENLENEIVEKKETQKDVETENKQKKVVQISDKDEKKDNPIKIQRKSTLNLFFNHANQEKSQENNKIQENKNNQNKDKIQLKEEEQPQGNNNPESPQIKINSEIDKFLKVFTTNHDISNNDESNKKDSKSNQNLKNSYMKSFKQLNQMIVDKKFDKHNLLLVEKMGKEYYKILNAMEKKDIKAFLQSADDSFSNDQDQNNKINEQIIELQNKFQYGIIRANLGQIFLNMYKFRPNTTINNYISIKENINQSFQQKANKSQKLLKQYFQSKPYSVYGSRSQISTPQLKQYQNNNSNTILKLQKKTQQQQLLTSPKSATGINTVITQNSFKFINFQNMKPKDQHQSKQTLLNQLQQIFDGKDKNKRIDFSAFFKNNLNPTQDNNNIYNDELFNNNNNFINQPKNVFLKRCSTSYDISRPIGTRNELTQSRNGGNRNPFNYQQQIDKATQFSKENSLKNHTKQNKNLVTEYTQKNEESSSIYDQKQPSQFQKFIALQSHQQGSQQQKNDSVKDINLKYLKLNLYSNNLNQFKKSNHKKNISLQLDQQKNSLNTTKIMNLPYKK